MKDTVRAETCLKWPNSRQYHKQIRQN